MMSTQSRESCYERKRHVNAEGNGRVAEPLDHGGVEGAARRARHQRGHQGARAGRGAPAPLHPEPRGAKPAPAPQRKAEAIDLQVLISSSLDRAENEIREVQKLIARQVEAVLLVPAVRWQHRLATLELVRASGIPTVLLDAYPAGAENFPNVSWVVCDDARGGQLATEHLLELGHKEILFLAGPNGSSSSAGRFSGYQRALAAAGLSYSDERVFLAAKTIESGHKAMAQALSEKAVFTAVVAYSDSVAIGAAEALKQQGFRIPEDVSIVGFGDGALATYYRVPLTTVHAPQAEMGETALRLAVELQKGKAVAPRQLPVEIIVRESTAKR
jgi:LacI family transcriptional regulator